jgi:hypothetical protein
LTWDNVTRQYNVQVSHEGKIHQIGQCADVVQAAQMYDKAAVKLFGNEARVNFPAGGGELQAQKQHHDDLHITLPAVQRLIRRDWVAVLAAAASLQDLVVTMAATAVSSKATWTTLLRRMAIEAGKLPLVATRLRRIWASEGHADRDALVSASQEAHFPSWRRMV